MGCLVEVAVRGILVVVSVTVGGDMAKLGMGSSFPLKRYWILGLDTLVLWLWRAFYD